MVLDRLEDSAIYRGTHQHFGVAFDFLRRGDLSSLAPGRVPLDGDKIYALVQEYQSKPVEQIAWEAHRRYIDIQYLISGQENIGYGSISQFTVVREEPERDLLALAGSGQLLQLQSGQFAIFWPHDAHAPALAGNAAGLVKKVVVKVLVKEQ
jgi:YhcH/YjgK/YiaL family protein